MFYKVKFNLDFDYSVQKYHWIHNDNWTEWSAIWAEIIRVISDQNCTVQGSITTLLHPFWNHPGTGLGQFKYFIDAVLS